MFALKTGFPLFALKSNIVIIGPRLLTMEVRSHKTNFKWLTAGQEQKVPMEKTAVESNSLSSCRDFLLMGDKFDSRDKRYAICKILAAQFLPWSQGEERNSG